MIPTCALHDGGEVVAPPFLPTNQIKTPKKRGSHVKDSCTRLTCELKDENKCEKSGGITHANDGCGRGTMRKW